MEHWTDDFEHASITDDAGREAFKTHAAKFPTMGDMAVNHMELAKQVGVSFKMPDMDKLDDAGKADFTSQAQKLLGITPGITDLDGLKDLDLKAGMAEGIEPDENLANLLKKYAVDKKLTVSGVQDLIGFFNGPITEYAGRVATANAEQAKLTADADKLAAATKTHEALIADPAFGSDAEVKKQSELLRRALQNNVGLSAEQFEEFGEEMGDSMLTKNPVMAKVMLNLLAPLAAESSVESGTGGKPKAGAEVIQDGKTENILWPKKT